PRPLKVAGCAPSATASRTISARPRVMSAANVLAPSPNPWHTPAAIAITFFIAPANSTPTTSRFVYSRNVGPAKHACKVWAVASSAHARTTAVGSPRAASMADIFHSRVFRASPRQARGHEPKSRSDAIRARAIEESPAPCPSLRRRESRCGSFGVFRFTLLSKRKPWFGAFDESLKIRVMLVNDQHRRREGTGRHRNRWRIVRRPQKIDEQRHCGRG